MKEGANNPNQKKDIQIPDKIRTLDEVYKKRFYEEINEMVNKGINEKLIKTPSCKEECFIDEKKIRRSLYIIDESRLMFILSVIHNILNDDTTLKYITEMIGPNSQLVNLPPINATKDELNNIILIINNLKKNKNFMSLLNKVNKLVK